MTYSHSNYVTLRLRLYGKDHEVVVLHLGGEALINGKRQEELKEVLRMCDKVFALIDSERGSPSSPLEPHREAFRKTCKEIGIQCHVLQRRATENYFTEVAIQAVLGPKCKALGLYDQPPKWWKPHNWRVAEKMCLSGEPRGA